MELGEDVGIWFNATLRGDNELIAIGAGSNIQENTMIHTDPGFPVRIGRNCTIGHTAIIHGCTIGDNSLIGMGATVLNGAKIGNNCLVGANALVTEGKEFPDNSLIVGSPPAPSARWKPATRHGLASPRRTMCATGSASGRASRKSREVEPDSERQQLTASFNSFMVEQRS